MKYLGLSIWVFCLLTSCRQVDEITGNRPIVDTKGINPEVYEADLQDCYIFADEVQAERKILTGAATGAVVGGVIGAAAGNSETAKRGAGVGAASGALSGTSSAMHERQRVVRNCLAGRGYLVLN
jgi:outer membrane lipoprotein SlyB